MSYILAVRKLWIVRYTIHHGILQSVAYTDCRDQAKKFCTRIQAWAAQRILKRLGGISSKIEKSEN